MKKFLIILIGILSFGLSACSAEEQKIIDPSHPDFKLEVLSYYDFKNLNEVVDVLKPFLKVGTPKAEVDRILFGLKYKIRWDRTFNPDIPGNIGFGKKSILENAGILDQIQRDIYYNLKPVKAAKPKVFSEAWILNKIGLSGLVGKGAAINIHSYFNKEDALLATFVYVKFLHEDHYQALKKREIKQ